MESQRKTQQEISNMIIYLKILLANETIVIDHYFTTEK